MITDTFEVKDEHLKLIRCMHFSYDEWTEFGAPEVNPKRPYGNGDVLGDMCDILGLSKPDRDNDEWYTGEQEQYLIKLHKECTKALAILAQRLTIDTGVYRQEMYHKWVKEN